MRVLHVIPGVSARYGGPSRAVFEMCRALERRGVSTLVATTDADGTARLSVELGRPIDYQGVRAVFFSRQWSEAFKYSRPLAAWLMRAVADFDIVHIHAVFSHSSIAAARACRLRGVPYVVRPLGSLSHWSMGQKRLRKAIMWRLGVGRMLGGAAAIHYTTAGERDSAGRRAELSRGVVVPLGVAEDGDAAGPAAGAGTHPPPHYVGPGPYVLMLCRLHPVKNLELFIETFISLARREKFRHWRLVVAGDGEPEYVARLKRLVPEGDDHVRFVGWLGDKDKAAVIRGASLMALPSRHENFGLSVVEALAYEVPVFVSRQMSLATEIEAARAGWVVEPSRHNMEEALAVALDDTDGRRLRGRRGRELVQARFTWPCVAAQLVEMYESVGTQSGMG